jgi:LmbE family N-acetylglucosaminyl deacetylase
LSGKVPVEVINVFSSSGDGRSTLSARAFLKQCRAVSPRRLFESRKKEDEKALSILNIKPVYLDKTDALWRKHKMSDGFSFWLLKILPELVSLYPTYRFYVSSGRTHVQDRLLSKELTQEIKKYLPKDGNYMLFSPLGTGGHVDHIIVRDACKSFAPKVIYWSDYPYLLEHRPDGDFIKKNQLESGSLYYHKSERLMLSRVYQTQFEQVVRCPETLELPEIYYGKN